VPLTVQVNGRPVLRLEHLLLDVNGTVTDRGALLPGVRERLDALRGILRPLLLTADTYGTLDEISATLGARARRVENGSEKADVVEQLGAEHCVAIGNGANDEAMLRAAALGIAILGPEGASPRTLHAADLVCPCILVALDLLTEPRALVATLRS
jgi:soluble P-type ATPase